MLFTAAILLPVLVIFVLAALVMLKKRRAEKALRAGERLKRGACPMCETALPGPVFAGPQGGYVIQCAGIGGCAAVMEIPKQAHGLLDIVRRRAAVAELRADGMHEDEIQDFLDNHHTVTP